MKVYDATSLRNVAIVGHGGCGKTQLVSTMLFVAGAVNRIGRVDDGTTITDFDEEEIARKHTLSSSLAYAEWQKAKINIIDTPGFANFLTDARAALRVAEAALVVVDAVAGVEVQTEKLWAEAAALGLPRIVVLNRLDRDRASLERSLESLRRDCAREIVPIQLPLGEEKAFTGVVDLVGMKAQMFGGDGKMTEGEIPSSLADAAKHAREQLIEMVAEVDEQLMETFFAEGTLTQEQLIAGLRTATMTGKIYPLLCTSGLHATAIQPLLDAIVNYAPSPAERDFRATDRQGAEIDGEGLRYGPVRRVRVEDDRRPVRRPDHHAAGRLGHAEIGRHRLQLHTRLLRAPGTPARAARQDADARSRTEGRRPRRRRQAEGHPHERRDRRQVDQHQDSADHVPGAGPRPTRSSRRVAATRTRSAARCIVSKRKIPRSSTRAIRRPPNCCSPARANSTSRSPSRS